MKDQDIENGVLEILVVEDSPTQAEELKYALERHNFVVSVACNGSEALSMIGARKPTMVISDIVMPEMDGYRLCREIKNDGRLKDLPVILLTALTDPRDVIKGLECGADNFITKPYDERNILLRIQYILANSHLKDAGQTQLGVEVLLAGERYFIKSDRIQILNLLLSSYEAAIQKNGELSTARDEMKALSDQLEQKVKERTAALTEEIVERKQVEKALQESEEKMRLLTETAVDSIVMIDDEGAIAYWNPASERVFGYQAPEVMGKSLHLLLAPKRYHDAFQKGFARYRETGCGEAIGKTLEMEAVRKDGTEIPVEVSFATMFLKEKRHAIGIIRDISERKKSEEDRGKIEEQLRHAQRMEAVGQLAGGIAHYFNNILMAIIGFSSIMKMKLPVDNPINMEIDQILVSSDKAADLTRSMLAFCRKQIMTLQPTELNKIIREGIISLQRAIGENMELRTKLVETPLNIIADGEQIEQVLMNLAANARDAMPGGGILVVETAPAMMDANFINTHGYGKPGAYAMITVSDSGAGMDENTRKRIFEPFFTTKEQGEGTGLGLSVVYGIVKQHDGFISCFSEKGIGTTFRVYLPIIDGQADPSEETPSAPVSQVGETILLVEDDVNVRTPIKLYLESYGYSVIEAADGEEGVNNFMANEGKIDLALIDVIMPRMNGREVYRRIRERKPEVKAIFMSGYTLDFLQQKEMVEEGMNILMKPADNRDLLKTVRNMLGK